MLSLLVLGQRLMCLALCKGTSRGKMVQWSFTAWVTLTELLTESCLCLVSENLWITQGIWVTWGLRQGATSHVSSPRNLAFIVLSPVNIEIADTRWGSHWSQGTMMTSQWALLTPRMSMLKGTPTCGKSEAQEAKAATQGTETSKRLSKFLGVWENENKTQRKPALLRARQGCIHLNIDNAHGMETLCYKDPPHPWQTERRSLWNQKRDCIVPSLN